MPIERPNQTRRQAAEIIASNIGEAKRDAKEAKGRAVSAQKRAEDASRRIEEIDHTLAIQRRNIDTLTDRYSDILDKLEFRQNALLFLVGITLAGLVILTLKLQGLI